MSDDDGEVEALRQRIRQVLRAQWLEGERNYESWMTATAEHLLFDLLGERLSEEQWMATTDAPDLNGGSQSRPLCSRCGEDRRLCDCHVEENK